MKKNKLFFALAAFLFLFQTQRANAQITKVDITTVYDSLRSYCSVPSTAAFNIYGMVNGTFSSTDSLTVKINFDDGFDTTFKSGISPATPGVGEFYLYVFHNYTFTGTFKPKIKITAPSGAVDSTIADSIVLSSLCATLSGRLYIDANGNCIRDASEKDLKWTPILAINTVTADSFFAGYTDDTGYYSITLLPGSYTIVPNPVHYGRFGYWLDTTVLPSCPTSGTHSFVVSTGGSFTKDFAYVCKTISSFDASIQTWACGFVPGDSAYIQVSAGSWYTWFAQYYCLSMSTTVTLTLDSKLSYLSTIWGKAPTSVSGSTVTWNLPTAKDVVEFYSAVWVKVASTATIGDTIRLTAYIAPPSAYTDPVLSNNTYNYKKAVSSSFDPNMKEVSPTGNGTPGYIAPNTDLTYTIHFQNTGTAPAKKVIISDEIDTDLDINSLHILHATHNANMYVDGRTVKFRFDNINLPDSGTNMKGSMGAITYGIKQKVALLAGTKINNTAAIYFDYNSPIITNTTLNTINIPTNIQNVVAGDLSASVYPNPANTELTVLVEKNQTFSIKMIDMLGRIVYHQTNEQGKAVIPTHLLQSGMYLVNIKNAQGNELNTKVMVKH